MEWRTRPEGGDYGRESNAFAVNFLCSASAFSAEELQDTTTEL